MVTSGAPRRGRYSKRGCRQCKTRRIKCDESKPSCWQCSRLEKPCLYLAEDTENSVGPGNGQRGRTQLSFARAAEERLTRAIWENRERTDGQVNGSSTSQRGALESELSTSSRESSEHPREPVANTSLEPIAKGNVGAEMPGTSHNANRQGESELVDTLEFPEQILGRRVQRSVDAINQHDLNLLASDLDSIVNNMMEVGQVGTLSEYSMMNSDVFEESDECFSLEGRRSDSNKNVAEYSDNIIPRNLPIDYIPFSRNNETLYFEEFYNNLATIIQPFQSYDRNHGYYCTTRDIFLDVASKEQFLLSAILSQGARMSYEKHGLKEDQEASYKYLVKCFRLFKPALLRSSEDSDLVSHKIEGVLLTILILASANASILNSEWRSHLRGAKELLLKFSANNNEGPLSMSRVMVFCKHWFISIEILAGLSSSKGGTLRNDSEMDLILSTSQHEMQILVELGIVRHDGFNLLVGIHHSCLTPIRDLIKLLNRFRNDGRTCITHDVIDLLSQLNEQQKIKFVLLEGTRIVENLRETKLPEGSLLESVSTAKGKLIISWMDISHQSYVLASMVILLRKGFQSSPSNQHVQCLNKELLNLSSFLADCHELSANSKNSMLLLQWPMLVAGLNCTRDEDRLIVMKFFRSLVNVGTTNSTYALRKFNKVWKHPNNLEENAACLDSSDLDVMTY